MNEEELKKGCGKKYVHSQGYDICGEHYGDGSVALCPNCSGKLEGFQKGKLEALNKIDELQKKIRRLLIDNSKCNCTQWTTKYGDISDVCFWELKEQLSKEIGGMK